MKLMLVFTVVLACAATVSWAAPQAGKDAEILEYEMDNIGIGGYKFSYKLSDGTSRTEEATVNNAGTENESLSVRGTISWVAPDGQTYTIDFVADENGFQPQGAHLPK